MKKSVNMASQPVLSRESLVGPEIDSGCKISIIIPAYNENRKIARAVESSLNELAGIASAYEVVIAEDGSSDGTYETAARLAESDHHIRLLHSRDRQGRGQALNRAIKAAHGQIICYIDADLATDMSHLKDLTEAISSEGYDIATGSRLMPESDTDRSTMRSIFSISFNTLVRLALKSRLHDHQCGFKAFKRDSIMAVLDQIRDNHWFWDTELLVRGQCAGLKIKEIPIRWRAADSTKVNVLKDSYNMGSKVVKLWWDLRGSEQG